MMQITVLHDNIAYSLCVLNFRIPHSIKSLKCAYGLEDFNTASRSIIRVIIHTIQQGNKNWVGDLDTIKIPV
jgi:hypothetical protein